jgi:AcrR family transcriptional regulator
MRYTKGHKQATRQRILEAAGRRFKEDGIDGAGVAAVMSDAGLTNGAFYAHFASKEDLVANVLADQLRAQRQNFDSQPPLGRDSKRSSARTCPRSTATRAPTAARRPRCSTRSPAAPPPPDRSSPTSCSTPRTTSRRVSIGQTPRRLERTRSRSSDS